MWQMKRWCNANELSLVWSEIVDVSDHRYVYDEMAAFYFTEAADATLFSLKFA